MNVKILKQYLNQKTNETLINEIIDLSVKFKIVRDYYQEKMGHENGATFEKYKSLITHEFFPTRGHGKVRLSIAKKAIMDFKKISQSKDKWVDLMLHYVEMGVKFTQEYGDINESFYSSMESMYDKVMKLIIDEKMKEFQQRCHKIVVDTQNMGWGFHDTLHDIYHDAFNTG